MSRTSPRAVRAGYALLLLTAVLGSTSGAPAPAPVVQPASAVRAQVDRDTLGPAAILIPCISGMCAVPLRAPVALVPLAAPPRPSGTQPTPYAFIGR